MEKLENTKRALATLLLVGAVRAEAQTYAFDPPHPAPGQRFTINAVWPSGGNFVSTQGVMRAGYGDREVLNVWFVQDGLNFEPNPPQIEASLTIPGLDAGAYRVNLYWVPDPETGAAAPPPQTFDFVVGAGAPPPFAIGSGITGNWYDPAESGHGFSLEVLGGVLLAEWFVYSPQGGHDWIIGTGTIDGNTAVLDAYTANGSGGRFPPAFDPAGVQNRAWGTLTFEFSDCNHGKVSWQSIDPSYGSGSLPIARLTTPDGLSCR
ncbi:MAG TPA: hypothetical protein VFB32_02290 [Rudaea sp.]|nr:hypothetical protein [Rudaea sp.]